MQQEIDTFKNWKKTTALFMSGQAISLFGSALVEFAVVWHITIATQSGAMMTIGTACIFLPRLVVSLFAGVWADRYNRKRIIMLADGGIAVATLILAILFLLGYEKFWLIFLILGIRSIGSGIQSPAVSAIIPQMVPEGNLMKINGINGSLQSVIMLLAPAAGGAFLAALPLGSIFFIDVVTAAIAISVLLSLNIKPHAKTLSTEKLSYYADLKAGLLYVKHNVFVKQMLIMYAFYFFLITPAAFLSPLAVSRTFGKEVWRLTTNEIAFSGGMMLGGAIIAWWGGFKNGINTIALSCFVIGVACIVLWIPNFYLFMTMVFLMGIVVSFFSSTEMSLFQRKVQPDMQGRVFGLIQIVASGVMPLAMLFFGPIADIIKVEILFVASGILITALGVYTFFNKKLKLSVEE